MKAVLLLGMLAVASAHICVWQPMQRGAFDISEPGASPCYRKVGPCGNVAPGPVTAKLVGGSTYTVLFQQNLNHYYFGNPGYLDASVAGNPNPSESDFVPFGSPITDYNAMNMITQTNFSITGVVPNVACSPTCVLRVRYVSNNPLEDDHGTNFYQCSDISITRSEDEKPTEARPAFPLLPTGVRSAAPAPSSSAPAAAGSPCCTVKQWQANSFQTGSWRNPTSSYIGYDSVNKLMRIDTNSGTGATIYDGYFQMYLNFTSGYQWYFNVKTNVCDLYGLDVWTDWCYGAKGYSQNWESQVTIGDSVCDVWGAPGNDFTFTNTRAQCTPVALARANGDLTIYNNVTPGIQDASQFLPPPQCHRLLHSQAKKASEAPLKDVLKMIGHPGAF